MLDKNKIFHVSIEQSFDCYRYEYKWFKSIIKTDRHVSLEEKCRYILAKSESEAIDIYKKRYKWEFEYPLDGLWNFSLYGASEWVSEKPNWEHIVNAIEVHPTFEKLKKELRAEDFFAYCKQEMYPIEVLIK